MTTSINPQPILFLDIDGPLVTNDSGGKEQAHPDTAVFKPEAVHFVNELVRIAGAKIVVISDWAGACMHHDEQYDPSFVPNSLIRAFERNGLVHDRFHSVWSHLCLLKIPGVNEKSLTGEGQYMRSWRPHFWLKAQGQHSHYAILDDRYCLHDDVLTGRLEMGLDPLMNPGFVRVNPRSGITRKEFDQALSLLIEGVRAAA